MQLAISLRVPLWRPGMLNMELIELSSKFLSLELQFKVLQAELTKVLSLHELQSPPSFAALEGLWGNQGNFSFAEIQEAEPHIPADL